jgi:hypothetical protein
MKDVPDDLERLPRLSPIEEPAIPARLRRARRVPGMTRRWVMGLFGIVLIYGCGWLLFFVFGRASMSLAPLTQDDPGYWPRVWNKVVEHGLSELIVAALGLLLGIACVTLAIRQRPVGPAEQARIGSS